MGLITGLIGLPALIKKVTEFEKRIEELEAEVADLRSEVAGRIRKLS